MDMRNDCARIVLFIEDEKSKEKYRIPDTVNEVIVFTKYDGKKREKDFLAKHLKDRSKCWLLVGLIISIIIIGFYIKTYFEPEAVKYGDIIISTLYQFALAYIVSLVFYYITVAIPQKIRKIRTRTVINNRLEQIAYDMRRLLKEIQLASYEKSRKIDFNVETSVLDSKSFMYGVNKYFSLGKYIEISTSRIRDNCEDLLNMFYLDLPLESIVVIDEAMNTYINRKDFFDNIVGLGSIEIYGDDIVEEYSTIIGKIEAARYK